MSKQKLSKRDPNTPPDTPLVGSNCGHELNIPEGRESVHDEKTFDNNSEVDLRSRPGSSHHVSNNVYVISMSGEPLMPTTPRKARVLVKGGKAVVINKKPYVIKLNYRVSNTKQEVVLGVDPGYKYLGLSAVTEKKEVYALALQ